MVLTMVTNLSGIISLILIERGTNFYSLGLNYVGELKNNRYEKQTVLLFVTTVEFNNFSLAGPVWGSEHCLCTTSNPLVSSPTQSYLGNLVGLNQLQCHWQSLVSGQPQTTLSSGHMASLIPCPGILWEDIWHSSRGNLETGWGKSIPCRATFSQ